MLLNSIQHAKVIQFPGGVTVDIYKRAGEVPTSEIFFDRALEKYLEKDMPILEKSKILRGHFFPLMNRRGFRINLTCS